MKQKPIKSQTTARLYQHPPVPRIPLWEHFVANVIDTLKLFAFLGTGLVLWYVLTFLFTHYFGVTDYELISYYRSR
ncbi:Uncharacterised protein [Acinetobacter haemolyticus]|uniref:hypothetical protein n=1 Tax=Acinetobacter haemolyticus TaxID=29430 RepID=UPI000E172482|nr:hypothetical protein [Acinetobacter haemolyticus]SUV41102.1 Uncharacterised protein [Acinetobacter haemolyticus]